jgi:hypothetical protein
MSFEISPNEQARLPRATGGNGLSIVVMLVAPLLAVLLTQYLNTRQARHTTIAAAAGIAVSLPEERYSEPRRELPPANISPNDCAQSCHAPAFQPEKQTLPEKMMARASGAKNDPAGQFAMLRLAKDLATQANDRPAAFRAIEMMAESFHVDADAMKMSVLNKLASVAREPAQHRAIAEEALKLENQAVAKDRLMIARQLGRLAVAEAKRSLDKELLAKAQGGVAAVIGQVRARERSLPPSGDWPK